MTHLRDDPTTFMEDMLVGFLDANQRYVVGVPGGVVRATQTPQGKVAVVVGGGSRPLSGVLRRGRPGIRRWGSGRQYLHLTVDRRRL